MYESAFDPYLVFIICDILVHYEYLYNIVVIKIHFRLR